MSLPNSQIIVSEDHIFDKIFIIRGQKVMLDADLARLYQVETKVLKQAVRRNIERFPEDFMFELSREEAEISRSQIVTLKQGHNLKYLPIAFTEQGVAMLSSVLKSERAIAVNIQIMRLFTKLRKAHLDSSEFRLEIEQIKRKLHNHRQNIELVFRYLDELVEKKEQPKKRTKIGY